MNTPRCGTVGDQRRWIVRPYQAGDRSAVRHVCCETGFLGDPQEPWFEGREAFADLFSRYYTDQEPEHAFVVEVAGRVEGYLLGCVDTERQQRIFNRKVRPRLALRMFHPGWWTRPVNQKFLWASLRSALMREIAIPECDIFRDYPAHLHINIADPALRGAGIGKALMGAFIDLLIRNRIRGVHLGTTSHNQRAVQLYKSLGFHVLVKQPLSIYNYVITHPPVFLLYLGKLL